MVGRAKKMALRASRGKREPKPSKVKAVSQLSSEISKYQVIGVLNMFKLPANAMQKIRNDMGNAVSIKFAPKSIVLRALQNAGRDQLLQHIGAQPALLLTNENPFKLYRMLAARKTTTAAKAGDIAPSNIEVKAGPTDIPPGPAISTLSKVGLLAKVEGGKIAISRDKTVVKAGEAVSPDVAAALQLLKMEPMEIGLDLVAAWDSGLVFNKEVMNVDQSKVLADFAHAAQQAVNLSINVGWPTKQTMPLMIMKAFANSKAVGLEAKILDKGIIEDLLARASAQAKALEAKIPQS